MELWRQALTIMIVGMGLVFAFLAVVIVCVRIAGEWIGRYEARRAVPAGADEPDVPALVAAIAATLHEQTTEKTKGR